MTRRALILAWGVTAWPVFAQSCPPAEQPALSRALGGLIAAGRADDAMQCVISIARSARDAGTELPDDVRYQLAKHASDAIESLGGDGSVMDSYNADATQLWQEYLDAIKAPFDRSRLPFALTKAMQHGRYGPFDQLIPSLAAGIAKAKGWFSTAQSDQLFSIVKRCPEWANTTYSGPLRCRAPCPGVARSLHKELNDNLGAADWGAAPGLKRLSQNAQAAIKETQACTR